MHNHPHLYQYTYEFVSSSKLYRKLHIAASFREIKQDFNHTTNICYNLQSINHLKFTIVFQGFGMRIMFLEYNHVLKPSIYHLDKEYF